MKPLARGLSHAFAGVPSVPGVILSLHELPPPQVMNAAMAEQPLEFMASKHGVSSKHGTRSGGGVSPNVYGLSTVRSGGGGGEILSISAKPPERGGCREGQSQKWRAETTMVENNVSAERPCADALDLRL